MDEAPWKSLKLSLERPYKNDNGDPIPILLDITPEGEHIYEPKDDPAKALGEKLRRIFIERGVDFFDRIKGSSYIYGPGELPQAKDPTFPEESESSDGTTSKIMTTEELYKMRSEIMPQLFIALGEMSHARELLSLLLSSPIPHQPHLVADASTSINTSTRLSATTVTKPPSITPVQAFNTQLVIGSKDEALRKAANIFKMAADGMERGRLKGEKYWVDALKIRRGNWGLIPAPLPLGSATGKGADKTTKDFLISFGLEESPTNFRRMAIGHMPVYALNQEGLIFPHLSHTRLRVSLDVIDDFGNHSIASHRMQEDITTSLEGSLQAAQQEVIEQEIFSLLVKEASSLPTASARVSERLIVIDVARGTELRFDFVHRDALSKGSSMSCTNGALIGKCDLIFHALYALLIRNHARLKNTRLGGAGVYYPPSATSPALPGVLQPLIDLLQYEVFCRRVKAEVDSVMKALASITVSSTFRFEPVGEVGFDLLKLAEDTNKKLGGEATLRIDNWHTVRMIMISPSSLTVHISQATLTISSIPQFRQLLGDEIERYLLGRIRDLGNQLCDSVSGTWFVDLNRCIGRWEGCVLNFRVIYGQDHSIKCSVYSLDRIVGQNGRLQIYDTNQNISLVTWVEQIIKQALRHS